MSITLLETGRTTFFQILRLPENRPHNNAEIMLRAKARANALKVLITDPETECGLEIMNAIDHPLVAHHGHHHSRFVEGSVERYAEELGIEQLGSTDDTAVVDALLLPPYIHDLDQQLGTLHNLQQAEEGYELPVKRAHGLGAAVMMLAMTECYAQTTGMSFQEARERTGMAAVMMMRHEDPEKFSQTFNQTNNSGYRLNTLGVRELIPDEELRVLFENDQLDLATLSPSQCITLLTQIKEKAGFMYDGRAYGLSPAFETEYKKELKALKDDKTPLLHTYNELIRERLKAAAEIFYRADMSHMVSPVYDSIARTFQGQYSLQRPIFSRLDPVVAERVIRSKDGKCPDDITRLAWELLNIEHVSDNSRLSYLEYTKQFNKDHAMLGILTLSQIAPLLMSGDQGIDEAISFLYKPRLQNLELKKQSLEEEGIFLTSEYTEKVQEILSEAEQVTDFLKAKYRRDGTYSQREIIDMSAVLARIKNILIERYKVKPEEIAKYEEMVMQGEYPDTQPVKFNDSIPVSPLRIVTVV